MQGNRYTLLISSRRPTTRTSKPCELSAIIPHPQLLSTLSPFLPTRPNSLPKSSPRRTTIYLTCFQENRLRTCLLVASLIIRFTLRMTRRLLIATSTHSLAQSSVSFMNSSTICWERASFDHPSHQLGPPSSFPRKKTAPSDSAWTSGT